MTAENRTLVLKNQIFSLIEKIIDYIKTLQFINCYEMQCKLHNQILKQIEVIDLNIEIFYN